MFVNAPALGEGAAAAAVQVDLAPCNCAGGKVEYIGVSLGTRPAKSNWVGTKHRQCAARGRDTGMAGRHDERTQTGVGQALHLGPECREMKAIVDDQCAQAGTAGFFNQQHAAYVKGQRRKIVLRIYRDYGA